MWTRFMDMHSGGGTKEPPYEYIYIEASMDVAKVIFYNRFGHNPDRVTCPCCGNDYAIDEKKTLELATAYNRGCQWDSKKKTYIEEPSTDSFRQYITLNEYIKSPDVLIIPKKDIKPGEMEGDVPEQGYVWVE